NAVARSCRRIDSFGVYPAWRWPSRYLRSAPTHPEELIMTDAPILKVTDLKVSTNSSAASATLLDHISLEIPRGGRVGLIGESGSGKSLTALSIIGLLPQALRTSGSITFHGRELLGLSDREMSKLRGKKIAMIFQEPMSALDPLMKVSKQIPASTAATTRLLEEVGLDASFGSRYPHQ